MATRMPLVSIFSLVPTLPEHSRPDCPLLFLYHIYYIYRIYITYIDKSSFILDFVRCQPINTLSFLSIKITQTALPGGKLTQGQGWPFNGDNYHRRVPMFYWLCCCIGLAMIISLWMAALWAGGWLMVGWPAYYFCRLGSSLAALLFYRLVYTPIILQPMHAAGWSWLLWLDFTLLVAYQHCISVCTCCLSFSFLFCIHGFLPFHFH